MRKLFRTVPAALAGLMFIVTACGDSAGPTGSNSGDPLQPAEAQELAVELFNVLFDVGLGGVSPAVAAQLPEGLSLALAADPIQTVTQSCEGGGNIQVSGEVNASSTSADFDIVESINGCVVTGSSTTFTLNGDPNVRMTGSSTFDGESQFSLTFDIRGGIAFTTDDSRSGTCAITIDIDGDFDFSDLQNPSSLQTAITVSGNVCGQNINSLGGLGT